MIRDFKNTAKNRENNLFQKRTAYTDAMMKTRIEKYEI